MIVVRRNSARTERVEKASRVTRAQPSLPI